MPTPQTTPRATVEQAAQHTLLIRYDRQTIALPMSEAGQLARALREHVYATAPELIRVLGAGTGPASTPTPLPDPDAHPETPEEDLVHGLACPHPGCDHIAWDDWEDDVFVVDEDERWSRFGYHREQVPELAPGAYVTDGEGRRRWQEGQRTGRQVWAETVTGSYSDSDFQGLGYRCGGCHRPVTLPDGVDEEGN